MMKVLAAFVWTLLTRLTSPPSYFILLPQQLSFLLPEINSSNFFYIISGYHRDTDSFRFPLFFFFTRKFLCVAMPFWHSSICKRNTLKLSPNKIISYRFLRRCFFAGDSCLYVSAALQLIPTQVLSDLINRWEGNYLYWVVLSCYCTS